MANSNSTFKAVAAATMVIILFLIILGFSALIRSCNRNLEEREQTLIEFVGDKSSDVVEEFNKGYKQDSIPVKAKPNEKK